MNKKIAMKYIALFAFIIAGIAVYAQDEEVWKEASKESQAYHQYRMRTTTPPYGLEKVKLLISKIRASEDENLKLNNTDYKGLPLREKFTYNMIHAESYNQICDAMPPIQEEQQKIFGYLPDAFGEYAWSERQADFFKNNLDSAMALIKESVARSKRIGLNYKMAIVEMKDKKAIPFLIKTYNADKKDHDILTILMLLMKDNQYKPFLASQSFRKLYGDEANYQAYLEFNKANEELILKRAMDFYNGK
jgi:hypothetical protein